MASLIRQEAHVSLKLRAASSVAAAAFGAMRIPCILTLILITHTPSDSKVVVARPILLHGQPVVRPDGAVVAGGSSGGGSSVAFGSAAVAAAAAAGAAAVAAATAPGAVSAAGSRRVDSSLASPL